jgi:hypothetical protein
VTHQWALRVRIIALGHDAERARLAGDDAEVLRLSAEITRLYLRLEAAA